MDVSIVVVNYNSSHVLPKCLDSIFYSYTALKYEVIVVDNASSDGGIKILKEKYKEVRFIESSANLGYPGGANRGVRWATGRAVLLLNPDAQLNKNTLQVLYERLMSSAVAGIAGPKVFYADGTLQSREVPKKSPALFDIFYDVFYLNRILKNHPVINAYYGAGFDYEKEQRVDVVHGSCFMVKKEVFEAVGFLDEKFFLYFDEFDFCLRAARAGYQSLYVPSASIAHQGGESAKKCGRKRTWFYYDSLIYFFRKHYGCGQACGLYLINLFGNFFRLFTIPLHILKDRDLERAREIFWAMVYHLDIRHFIR